MGELARVLDDRAEWPDSTGVRSTIEFRALVARSERSSVFEEFDSSSCPIPTLASNSKPRLDKELQISQTQSASKVPAKM